MWLYSGLIFALCVLSATSSCPDQQSNANKISSNANTKEYKIIDGVYVAESLREQKSMQQHRSFFERILDNFQKYELHVRLADLLNSQTVAESGRRRDRGLGAVLAVGAMLIKFLITVGFGSVGLLAMKALMVSTIALLLSVILGLKKLVAPHSEHHSHGDEHRKRRRRDIDELVYSAWNQYVPDNNEKQ